MENTSDTSKLRTGRDKFSNYKRLIHLCTIALKVFPKSFMLVFWIWSDLLPDLLSITLKYMILKRLVQKCGDNVFIGRNVEIKCWENLEIGNNVSIHKGCYIDATGSIVIGNNVSIAHSTSILSANHTWENEALPIKYNPVSKEKVTIDDDVWIGCGCRIMAGVKIASRTVVAAGAVVVRDVPHRSIVGGVPAKIIKRLEEIG